MTQKATDDLPARAGLRRGPEAVESLDSPAQPYLPYFQDHKNLVKNDEKRTLRAPRGEDKNKSIRFQILSFLFLFAVGGVCILWESGGEPVLFKCKCLLFFACALLCGRVGCKDQQGQVRSGHGSCVRRYYPAFKKRGQGFVCTE